MSDHYIIQLTTLHWATDSPLTFSRRKEAASLTCGDGPGSKQICSVSGNISYKQVRRERWQHTYNIYRVLRSEKNHGWLCTMLVITIVCGKEQC